MKLEIGRIKITDVQFGPTTAVKDGILTINKDEMIALVKEDVRLKSVEVELAKPGESVRIVPVKDVIEPRVKVEGSGEIFPGMVGDVETVGDGRTLVLDGCAIVTVGKIVGFQEGIIDMTGPGAEYTPFSQTLNVVLVIHPQDGMVQHEYENAVRLAGFKTAVYLGKSAKEVKPDTLETYESLPYTEACDIYPTLPRVAYVYMLQSQGLLHDTYVYGIDAKRTLPTLISPTEIMDGAIVSGNCVSACDKNTTYHHLNNPIIEDLFKRHGKEFNFIGVIITNENVTLADKKRSSSYTAKLCDLLGLDGVIVSEEGFGNPDTDLIMNCVKIESKGIRTVLVTDEYAGRDGASQSLADANPKADAVVTAGNANEVITLPKLARIIGNLDPVDRIAGGFDGSLSKDGTITVEIQAITGSTNELGFSKLTSKGI